MIIKTKDLLTTNRIDVIFKILYLKLNKLGAQKVSKKIYKDHIRIITNGIFQEEGSNKKTLKDYVFEFKNILNSFTEKGYDKVISKIPLAIDGTISNGSHRLATSIFLNIDEVEVELTNEKRHNYNYNFFIKRGLRKELLDFGILEYLNLTQNNFLAIIWPSANKKINYVESFENIIYEKKIKLNPLGAQNFVAQVYKEHRWVGDFKNGYGGAISKVRETFKNYSYLHIIFFKEQDFKNVINLKEKLRELFGIQKASIHITDNDKETLELGNIILNDNSINFIKQGIPYKYPPVIDNLKKFRELLIKKNIDINSLVISGDTVLGIYGLKSSNTVGFISKQQVEINHKKIINETDIYFSNSNENVEEHIYNPKNYFNFYGFKFQTLESIKKLKSYRNSPEDWSDIKLINSKNSSNKIDARDYIDYYKFKIIGWIIHISKKFNFYGFAKEVYKFLNSFSKL